MKARCLMLACLVTLMTVVSAQESQYSSAQDLAQAISKRNGGLEALSTPVRLGAIEAEFTGCLKEDKTAQRLVEEFSRHCSVNVRGRFFSPPNNPNYYCINPQNPDEVVFFLQAEQGKPCAGFFSGAWDVTFHLIEVRKLDRISSPYYMDVIRSTGYRFEADKEKERQQAQRRREDEMRQRQYEAQAMKKVGTRICRDFRNMMGANFVYIGFVENFTEDQVQIRVNSAVLKGSAYNISPGGFQPHITWDSPLNWYMC